MKRYKVTYKVKYCGIFIDGDITVSTTTRKRAKEMTAKIVFKMLFHQLGININEDDVIVIGQEFDFSYRLQTVAKEFLREVID